MKELTVLCPAKINLTLDILGPAPGGYHEIESIMQAVTLFDRVTVSLAGGRIDVRTDLPYVPRDSRNTAYKAAAAFFATVKATYGVRIDVKKSIPVAAGLAGGSADGAGVVYALNTLFEKPLNDTELNEVCRTVGADVAFCLNGGTALACGIGERLTRLHSMPDCGIVIVKPYGGLSAGDVYKKYDASPASSHPNLVSARDALENGDLSSLCNSMGNVFDGVCVSLMPVICDVIRALDAFSPLKTMVSGSGSSVFAVFPTINIAENCKRNLSKRFKTVFAVSPFSGGVTPV